MQIKINGQEKQITENLTVAQLLTELDLKGPLAVERNREICPKTQHQTTPIQPGDILEIVTIVGGG
jgi:thiamine biosynthesis protein ThiS